MDQTLTDRIRERAYEIWVASGCPHGAAGDHWLAAEREILNAPQTAAERESLDAPQTALAAQSPMVKKSSRARRAAQVTQTRHGCSPQSPLRFSWFFGDEAPPLPAALVDRGDERPPQSLITSDNAYSRK
jgi:hypothetical protein